jgi:hypothetical protein
MEKENWRWKLCRPHLRRIKGVDDDDDDKVYNIIIITL